MKSKLSKILVISGDRRLVRRIKDLFVKKQVTVDWERQFEFSQPHFDVTVYDVILLVRKNPKQAGGGLSQFIDIVKAQNPSAQVIFLVTPEAVNEAIAALKSGTFQYAKLPVGDTELRRLIEIALDLKSRPPEPPDDKHPLKGCDQLVGDSLPMQQVYRQIRQAAATNISVLLFGETGTGKDLTAQAIHRFSASEKEPYVATNLGALPTDLVASELFGHEKGSFTGAGARRKGLFEEAGNGTLFLDEIEAISQKVQVSLLRLLEEKYFQRLGGKQKVENHARLIAACNQNLEELVAKEAFRRDLFYRLDVFRITLPPLRERSGDIPLLAAEFLKQFKGSVENKITGIDAECMRLLQTYDWPGNVRELRNVIQRAVIACEGKTILPEHLPSRFLAFKDVQPTVTFEIGTPIEQVEREMIVRTLATVNNNRKQAAELLGISRRAIYNKFEKHDIE